jgi:hypothetical protein
MDHMKRVVQLDNVPAANGSAKGRLKLMIVSVE